MLVSQRRAQITKPMLKTCHFFSDQYTTILTPNQQPVDKVQSQHRSNAFPQVNFPGWMLRRLNTVVVTMKGHGFDSRVGPVMSFLHMLTYKEYYPECRIIGVTPVNSWMLYYDLAVKQTSGLFRSGSGWHRPDSTVHRPDSTVTDDIIHI
jgi:hypothetical protein